MTLQLLHKKFTVGQYHQMIESGILTDRDRVELLQGEIIEMSPVGQRHAACVDRATELCVLSLASQALVRVQSPIHLSNDTEPQPDLAILKRQPDFYASAHPQSQDIFALIEVSDTTVDFDRTVKVPLYAQDSIAEVWVLDLNAQIVWMYRDPSPNGYQLVRTFGREQCLTLLAFPKISFSVDQLLG